MLEKVLPGTVLSVHIVFELKSILGDISVSTVDKSKKLKLSVCILDKKYRTRKNVSYKAGIFTTTKNSL